MMEIILQAMTNLHADEHMQKSLLMASMVKMKMKICDTRSMTWIVN